jgi:transposase
MDSQKDKRQRVSDLIRAQIDPKKIHNIVGVSLSTVYNVKNTRYLGNGIQRKTGSGVINKKRNRDFVNAFKSKMSKDSTTSMRKIAAELKVDPKTIRMSVHEDLGVKSNTRTTRHLLTESMKARNLERCKKVLEYIKNHGSTVKIFS